MPEFVSELMLKACQPAVTAPPEGCSSFKVTTAPHFGSAIATNGLNEFLMPPKKRPLGSALCR
jgi:hypothetical protein